MNNLRQSIRDATTFLYVTGSALMIIGGAGMLIWPFSSVLCIILIIGVWCFFSGILAMLIEPVVELIEMVRKKMR